MGDQHYRWQIGSPPPDLAVHSLAKHRVIERYVSTYLKVLTSQFRMERFRLSIVDGFAGGGSYLHEVTREEVPGSPLIFLRAVESAIAEVNLNRTKPIHFEIEFFFCDKETEFVEHLRYELNSKGYGNRIGDDIFLVEGEFRDKCGDIVKKIKRRPPHANRAIFLLDQYAYKDVPLQKIRYIFAHLPNAEVLLTFGIDQLINYLSDNTGFRTCLERLELSASERDYLTSLKSSDRNWRKLTQQILYGHLVTHSQSRYFTPFFIRSEKSRRAYWFIHLSQHQRARDEMVSLHWEETNYFSHYGGASLDMLGFDPAKNPDPNQHELEFGFDDSAKKRSETELLNDLPSRIYDIGQGISFHSLCEMIANETPATNAMIESVILELKREGEIEILNASGKPREVRTRINKKDILTRPQQLIFPTFSRKKDSP